MKIVPKGWGREVWLANNELYCGRILEILKGKRCSLHFHKLKTESFFLRAGRLRVSIKESAAAEVLEEFELRAGECLDIPRGLVHQMEALEDSELFEFSTQHFDSDSNRLPPATDFLPDGRIREIFPTLKVQAKPHFRHRSMRPGRWNAPCFEPARRTAIAFRFDHIR